MKLLLTVLAGAIFICSCSSTRKIQTAISTKDTTVQQPSGMTHNDSMAVIRETVTRLQSQRINFQTFNAKIDIDYEGSSGKEKANANLRMYKDSLIWVSLTGAFGIEGMRAIIDVDSIRIINKLNKVYTARSLSYLQDVTGLPLTLNDLQDLLIGNPIFLDSSKVISYNRSGNSISILSIGAFFNNLVTLSEGQFTLSKLDDTDPIRHRTCDLSCDDYENKKGVNFSTRRRVTVTEHSKLDIKMDFKNYDFNETLSFPFSVPKSYERN